MQQYPTLPLPLPYPYPVLSYSTPTLPYTYPTLPYPTSHLPFIGSRSLRRDEGMALITQILIMSKCDAFIGSYSSNVVRF